MASHSASQQSGDGADRRKDSNDSDQAAAIPNPFELEYNLDWRKKTEIVLGAVLLLPVRLCLSFVILGTALVSSYIVGLGLKQTDRFHYVTPITGWRRRTYDFVIPFLTRLWLYVLGFWHIPFKGRMANPKEAPIIVMAPHSSYMDALIPLIFPYVISGVTKLENRRVPVLGALCDVVSPIYVLRGEKASREVAQEEIARRAREGGWPPIIIYVEGTCTNRRALLPFKTGAFAPGTPVQPAILRYDGSPFCVWTLAHPMKLIFITFCTFINHTSVEFMDPVVPTQEEKDDPQLYAENVRKIMAQHLKVPLSSCGYRDFVQMQREQEESKKRS